MNTEFQRIVEQMERLLEDLRGSREYTRDDLRDMTKQGVYVLYENEKPIYVGRSRDLDRRIREHSARSRHNSATFAFILYREKLGNPEGKREEVQAMDPPEYERQRQRVGAMTIRAVEIEDPWVQAVFEIYAVLALGTTKYNTFETH